MNIATKIHERRSGLCEALLNRRSYDMGAEGADLPDGLISGRPYDGGTRARLSGVPLQNNKNGAIFPILSADEPNKILKN